MVKMRIMLVDDEERFLQTTQKLLAKQGHEAIVATSGSECLEKLKHELVHVVILDVKMPGMDGVETLKRIKQRFPMVEVIMLTGHATAESAVEGLKSGASDYLVKPADVEVLIGKAEEAFQRRMALESKIQTAEALKMASI
ncbi:response regulator [Desulfatitalea alkaliphila]|uniref:Response regulator n=1 Tax=Desulfatitalea alkaliphila TaxID=2929485 RepID=A0AA41UHZ1_9BACT|nr:response regulator [Desulfatitalea alkaliphila]MCJ8500175.1 response regulator [Desulfatitalea alkaliphila]